MPAVGRPWPSGDDDDDGDDRMMGMLVMVMMTPPPFGDEAMGMTQTESTFQQYTVRSLFCWVKFIFLPALFWMPFLGKSLEHDFLLFHIGIITMH